jgi:hypothetical protein
MRKTFKTAAVAGGILLALAIPAGVAYAAAQPGAGAAARRRAPTTSIATGCTCAMAPAHGTTRSGRAPHATGGGHAYQAGPLDRTDPRADRPLNDTGSQFGK